jgi:predicted nuclease with TOPRIM domain
MQTNFEVIDQFFAAQIAANENEETLKALRPQVEEAVKALIAERGLGKSFTGTIEYNGIKIVVSRPKIVTWEQNNQIKDENLDYYKRLHSCYEQLQDDIKSIRKDLKHTSEKLEKAHPESESIKHGFRIAFV